MKDKHMTTNTKQTQKALRMALEALEVATTPLAKDRQEVLRAITAIREALADHIGDANKMVEQSTCKQALQVEQPAPVAKPHEQQEPVARSKAYDMIDRFLRNNLNSDDDYAEYSTALDSLYTSPPASKPWVGLTDKEKKEIYRLSVYVEGAISLTEAKLREKNA